MPSQLEETITKGKVAGVPVWGAGVFLALLFFGIMYVRNRKAATTAVDPNAANANGTGTFDPNAIDPATGLTYGQEGPAGYGLPSGPIGSYLSNNPTFPGYPVGAPAQGLPAPITNQQWSRLAFDELVAKGDDPTLVGNALSKFLAGQTLSDAEKAIVSLAETIFGAPPEGLIPTNTGSTPPPSADTGIYYFGIEGDAHPETRYIGIPGIGYYPVPDIGTAQRYLDTHPQTISLGQISQAVATQRFGPSLPWATFGSGPSRLGTGNNPPGSLGGTAVPLGSQ